MKRKNTSFSWSVLNDKTPATLNDKTPATLNGKTPATLKGWMRQIFLADQNQHVSKPTRVKLQCNRHSRSALKSVLKMAK